MSTQGLSFEKLILGNPLLEMSTQGLSFEKLKAEKGPNSFHHRALRGLSSSLPESTKLGCQVCPVDVLFLGATFDM
jgi:hypothetical protein